MKNDWKYYTTHEGNSFIRNIELDEKNFFRMKIFVKNYFKSRCSISTKKQTSLLYSIVMSISGEKNGKENEFPFSCDLMVDNQKIDISWSKTTGVSVIAASKEGNSIIRELFGILKDADNNEFWEIKV